MLGSMHYALGSRSTLALFVSLFVLVTWGCGDAATGTRDAGADGATNPTDGGHDLVCRGTATRCEALDVSECTESIGCLEASRCDELPRECAGLDVEECVATPGCDWIGIVGRCGVVFIDCASGSASNCTLLPGCTWTPGCEGLALDCAQLSVGDCEGQAGCALEPRESPSR